MTESFGVLDWSIVGAVLVGTTVLARLLAGRQRNLDDYFLGGRQLPWWAVAASLIATEISAVTYVSLPAVVYRPGGNLTYLQIGLIGWVLSRLFVAWLLVPAYYERHILSPYDYMGRRLGEPARRLTTVLFSLGGVLAQSARVYLTALVLQVLLHRELAAIESVLGLSPLVSSVALLVAVATFWTLIGGIAAVVWTDAVLFVLFVLGAGLSLAVVGGQLDGGLAGAFAAASDAGKLQLFDLSLDPVRPYTLWTAVFLASWGGVFSFGTDQLMVQRLLCCRDSGEARKAVVASSASVLISAVVAIVGVALWAYYDAHPLTGEAARTVAEQPDRIFPVFMLEAPPALRGLLVAGVFAAAISSLDSILAALAQTTISVWRRLDSGASAVPESSSSTTINDSDARGQLRASRALVVVWGIVLGAAAVAIEEVSRRYDAVLDLALAMAGYTGGALLAGFFLAHLVPGRARCGYLYAAPLSVLAVFGLVWHAPWAQGLAAAGGLAMLVAWLVTERPGLDPRRLPWALAGVALPWVLSAWAVGPTGAVLPWPWYIPIGSGVAFGLALALGDKGASASTTEAT